MAVKLTFVALPTLDILGRSGLRTWRKFGQSASKSKIQAGCALTVRDFVSSLTAVLASKFVNTRDGTWLVLVPSGELGKVIDTYNREHDGPRLRSCST